MDIRWGSYGGYSGPWCPGDMDYVLPLNPTFIDKALAVITATEGGRWNAYNAYDRCGLTTGLIQWGELCSKGSVTEMMVECHKRDPASWGVMFDGLGVYVNGSIISPSIVRMARGGGDGKSWTEAQKISAKIFAERMVKFWTVPAFLEVQKEYTKSRVLSFAFGRGASLFEPGFPTESWDGALRAVYLSFAANLPGLAQRYLPTTGTPRQRCLEFISKMVNSGIAIYPGRAAKIKPVVAKLFGVRFEPPTVAEIQYALIQRGYDVGSTGADGVYGRRTRGAVVKFQQASGLAADGVVGPLTLEALGL